MALLAALRNTPLHPQWFAFYREPEFLRDACDRLSGVVLDIGCADGKPRDLLAADATYIGLDYLPTASEWYGTSPDVYADAARLPFGDGCVDHVLLLDVMEHLPDPHRALAEIERVLATGGTLTLQVPFLYPVHDAPRDFTRWTRHGLELAAAQHGFTVRSSMALGHPAETAALNANIASSRTVLNWIRQKNPLAVLVLALPLLVVARNVMAWLAARLSRDDDLMPYAYRAVWVRE